jgi:hypothetical protein
MKVENNPRKLADDSFAPASMSQKLTTLSIIKTQDANVLPGGALAKFVSRR